MFEEMATAGFRLDGEVLLLVLPRRSTQEEVAPAASPGCAGCSALLGQPGRLRNSGLRPSNMLADYPPTALRCSTTQRAERKAARLDRPAARLSPLSSCVALASGFGCRATSVWQRATGFGSQASGSELFMDGLFAARLERFVACEERRGSGEELGTAR